jgi:hypothetical protein
MGEEILKRLQATIARNPEIIQKARVYVKRGHKPPKGAVVHRGGRGGVWYESGKGSAIEGTNEVPMSEREERYPYSIGSPNQTDRYNYTHRSAVKYAFNKVKENMRVDPDHYGYDLHSIEGLKQLHSFILPYKGEKEPIGGGSFKDKLKDKLYSIRRSVDPKDYVHHNIMSDFQRHYNNYTNSHDTPTVRRSYRDLKKTLKSMMNQDLDNISLDN